MDAGVTETVTDKSRYPTLSADGEKLLQLMREHPAAPLYRNQSGNRLTAHEVEILKAFEHAVPSAAVGWPSGAYPDWLEAFVHKTYEDVPHYRALGSPPLQFEDIPVAARHDFASDIAPFVPDSADISRLINFRTTGTTGHPLLIASHPLVAGRYLAFHKRALRRQGIELQHGRGQVGVVLVGHQRKCFTYVSVTPSMDESGLAKINLHPADWRDPAHRAQYLDALAPEIYSGDPISFAQLAQLPLVTRPRALISVSMALIPGMRRTLEQRFACPVLDVYSMNEAGPIGVYDETAEGHVLLQPQLYVEILDRSGRPVADGVRGEITLTGGFNFCLPLLRYRTGDFAAMGWYNGEPVLHDLQGRPPVRFQTDAGEWINNIDVTHALSALPIPQFGLHQRVDRSLLLRLAPSALNLDEAVFAALAPLFGNLRIETEQLQADDKINQYTSALETVLSQ